MLAAYLIDPGRPAYEIDDLAQEYGLEVLPEPDTEEETSALVRHAEAARRLGVPEGTVKSRTHYALRALKLALEEMGVSA